ncbi:MAG: hypothetical protein IKP66_09560 [Lachnospiraceae bacterium]|nr:hypothetical protein [Lachnospiraceae bacterium]
MKRLFVLLCIVVLVLSGCGEKKAEETIPEEPIIVTNTKPEKEEYVEEDIWVDCPTLSTKVGTTYTFIDGNIKYITTNVKYGAALYEGLKYPNITAQISVKPRTVVNPTEYDILDIHFYDNGTDLRLIKTIDELWAYYKETYTVSTPGDKFSGVYQLTGVTKEKNLNGQTYLALTFTDEDFSTFVCQDYDKQDMLTLNESYYGNWYDITYRVEEGLHYNENRTDVYYRLTSMKDY